MRVDVAGDGLFVSGERGDNLFIRREYQRADGRPFSEGLEVQRADVLDLVLALLRVHGLTTVDVQFAQHAAQARERSGDSKNRQ